MKSFIIVRMSFTIRKLGVFIRKRLTKEMDTVLLLCIVMPVVSDPSYCIM
jgi:hypothetical protein